MQGRQLSQYYCCHTSVSGCHYCTFWLQTLRATCWLLWIKEYFSRSLQRNPALFNTMPTNFTTGASHIHSNLSKLWKPIQSKARTCKLTFTCELTFAKPFNHNFHDVTMDYIYKKHPDSPSPSPWRKYLAYKIAICLIKVVSCSIEGKDSELNSRAYKIHRRWALMFRVRKLHLKFFCWSEKCWGLSGNVLRETELASLYSLHTIRA